MEHYQPMKQDLDLTKLMHGQVVDTPNFDDLLKIKEEYTNA